MPTSIFSRLKVGVFLTWSISLPGVAITISGFLLCKDQGVKIKDRKEQIVRRILGSRAGEYLVTREQQQ